MNSVLKLSRKTKTRVKKMQTQQIIDIVIIIPIYPDNFV